MITGLKVKAEIQAAEDRGEIVYSQSRNTILQRVTDMKLLYWNNYAVSRQFGSEWGQPLVIDLSHYHKMTFREQKSLAYRELPYSLGYNRECPEPFQLYLTNFEAPKMDQIVRAKPNWNSIETPEVFTEKSYTELFDHKNLVYLSPDSRDYYEYNPDDVCIIGGLVDRNIKSKASLSIAKTQNIRHAKIPTKPILGFECVLNVETMVAIMLDYRRTRDWNFALRWVPPRYFRNNYLHRPFTFQEEYTFLAHKKLHPNNGFQSDLGLMSTTAYRQEFQRILKMAPKSKALQDPSKYMKEKRSTMDDL